MLFVLSNHFKKLKRCVKPTNKRLKSISTSRLSR
nr:MAG TPA: hypothetical protein [Caudoviricetes sp.]